MYLLYFFNSHIKDTCMYMEHDHPKPEPFKNNILVINYMYLRGKNKEELK